MGILGKLRRGMLLFGISMGLVFPLFAGFFAEFRPGMRVWFSLGCIIAGVAVGGFSYLLVKIILLKHLSRLATACREISEGRLDVDVTINSRDEIGDISVGFNRMVAELKGLFGELKAGIENLNGVSEALSAISETLEGTIHEQGLSVSQINAAIHQTSSTIAAISSDLSSATEYSGRITDQAFNAGEMLSGSMKTMRQTRESMDRTIDYMKELNEQSSNITEVLSIIDDIAEQTNLLALNAAIEAARAGEQGRGFAVVADEVRKLAEKTSASTKKTGDMIRALQAGVDATIASVKEHSELVSSLEGALGRSAQSMSAILGSIEKVSSAIDHLSGALKEQTDASESINHSMEEINRAFQDITDLAGRVVVEGGRIREFTGTLASLMGRLRDGRGNGTGEGSTPLPAGNGAKEGLLHL